MIPLHDNNPSRSVPVLTYTFIAINLLVFLYQQLIGYHVTVPGAGSIDVMTFRFGLIPFELTGAEPVVPMRRQSEALALIHLARQYNFEPSWATMFTSMFLHGGWGHLLGNMLFLGIFGNNVEDALGKVKYLLFYLGCGVIAGGLHVVTASNSFVPTVGASGAIAGVLGGYLLLFPTARVTCLTTFFIFTMIELPAKVVLGLWFVFQLFMGLQGWGAMRGAEGGVAYAAHIGGFVAGYVLVRLLAGRPEPPRPRYYTPEENTVQWR